ncbi:hypothetical protein MPH_06117 [Macrophomina phaseolina MS6]|uniref:Uncharacterized protein n=2 Tax=Macrophomina phaseolina TaxID=35725 RepID=K2RPJ0_MACPH|nr:hypothetical protein MPH_06117 [Macrophomina phaseolina MS6]KAH7063425.1 hypothetical protein B0J12DRAFT_735320 [Macrophomina phaseolina]
MRSTTLTTLLLAGAASLTAAAPVGTNDIAARDPINGSAHLKYLEAVDKVYVKATKDKRAADAEPTNRDAILKFLGEQGLGDGKGTSGAAGTGSAAAAEAGKVYVKVSKEKRDADPTNRDAILKFLGEQGLDDEKGTSGAAGTGSAAAAEAGKVYVKVS